MSPHFGSGVSESVFTDARDDSTNAHEDLLGGDAEYFLHIGVDVCVDGSRRISVQVLAGPGADDGAERGILGSVHGNGFITLFILLEEESNGDTARQVKKIEAADSSLLFLCFYRNGCCGV